ncbi:hypothetical protein GGH91_000019 [Coemansia sp. RSA 2671]|nr:hypothetical protein LPJ60_000238 [Coemansia sp. RSA 2675]KAJ2350561.1 hypothetical protein GGH91_000019 [Coemansia sp. RSA 2671]
MAISIGGYSTLLFGVGLVALVASCLQIVVYAKAARELELLVSHGSLAWVYGSSISPLTVVRLAIVVSSLTLVITSVFTGLDLAGMIVLRSRMWRHFSARHTKRFMASACGPVWWPPLAPGSGQWPADEKEYEEEADMTISWWQQWVFLEDLVFAIQRNLAFIRMAAAMLLALLWAPTVVQLVVVSMAGRCHTVAKSTVADEEALEACDLMRKGTIGAIAAWACWTVLAALLVSFNTSPCGSRPLSSLPFMRVPMPDVACGPVGCRTSVSLPLGQKQQQRPQMGKGGMPPTQAQPHLFQQPQFGGYQAYQHRQQGGGLGQKKHPGSSYRSSWSYMDKGSATDSCKGDTQSIGQGGKPGILHPQNMVHQLYHLQNQQFQSLHQIQQASRISEERLYRQQLASHKAVQRQLSLTLQQGRMYSSEQSFDTDSVPTTNTEFDNTRHELHSRHLYMLQQARGGIGQQHRPVRGASISEERISQSLTSFDRHNSQGPGSEERGGDKASKRNTIG